MADGPCSVDGCDLPAFAKGLCRRHHKRWWRHGDALAVKPSIPGPRRPRPAPDPPTVAELAAVDLSDTTWQAQAACRGVAGDVMHPEDAAGLGRALLICSGCPVQRRCLAHALAAREEHGVWGGASKTDRRRMLRDLRWAS